MAGHPASLWYCLFGCILCFKKIWMVVPIYVQMWVYLADLVLICTAGLFWEKKCCALVCTLDLFREENIAQEIEKKEKSPRVQFLVLERKYCNATNWLLSIIRSEYIVSTFYLWYIWRKIKLGFPLDCWPGHCLAVGIVIFRNGICMLSHFSQIKLFSPPNCVIIYYLTENLIFECLLYGQLTKGSLWNI